MEINVKKPVYEIKKSNLISIDDDMELKYNNYGRKTAIEKMHNFIKKDYSLRDFPELNMASFLSADIKFGTISIREAYHYIKDPEFRRQLYWRDFYLYIAYHFPYVFGSNFNRKYNIKWENNEKYIDAWKNGLTGYPIVDAAMRSLNETGYINNRLRMIVSSFLVKDLHVDWRIGEKYFAQKLIDYDPASNNGNWQWVASTGVDSRGMYRIINPWIQQKKFDPECKFIKRYVNELSDLEPEIIHNLYKIRLNNYPAPLVDHKTAVMEFRKLINQTPTYLS
ncbi:cryptochrome/photolyase family protein [Picrophilus oshimae]|uniref:cryptochrome/photolyase family protein n=1 Tax=Picrophilus oshimae TaxID=46632 RepID=UPI00191C815C|nr:deoxyribodipyrimidine photo-lyase [Picrophilus oshimae]